MKGYITENGYMGFIFGSYMLFACEEDYVDFYYENQIDLAA